MKPPIDEIRVSGEFAELQYLNAMLTQRCVALAGELAATKKAVEAAALINAELTKQLETKNGSV